MKKEVGLGSGTIYSKSIGKKDMYDDERQEMIEKGRKRGKSM